MTALTHPEDMQRLSEALAQLYVIDGEFPFFDVSTGQVTTAPRKGHRPITGFELVLALDRAIKQRAELDQAVACMQAILDGRPPIWS